MTNFEPKDHYFRMQTLMLTETADTIQAASDLEGHSLTESVRQVLGVRALYDQCRATGSLLIAGSIDAVEALTLPQGGPIDEAQIQTTRVSLNVNTEAKDYLENYSDPDNPLDLLDFWRGAVGFYSDVRERQLLGSKFYQLRPNLSFGEFIMDDPFTPGGTPEKQTALAVIKEWLARRRQSEPGE